MLSAAELQDLRDAAKNGMPDRLELYRPGEEDDPMGGTMPGEPEKIGEEICGVTTNLSSSALVGDQQRTSADAVVRIPADSPLVGVIEPTDRVQIVGGDLYEVQGHAERSGTWDISRRVLVARV